MTALFVSENELVALLGVPKERWPAIAKVWEREGFPAINLQVGKRYLPAVRAWLDRKNGVIQSLALVPDGEENYEHI